MKFFLNDNYFFITNTTSNSIDYLKSYKNRQIALDQLHEVEKIFQLIFDAYSILLNHYHLLFYLPKGINLPKIMQKLNGGISYKIKNVPKPMWQKYIIRNISSEKSFYKVQGYILGNPLKHALVNNIDGLNNYSFCNYKEKVKEFDKETIDDLIFNTKNLNWEQRIPFNGH
jgi:REP element-mobilizing transposase RayT